MNYWLIVPFFYKCLHSADTLFVRESYIALRLDATSIPPLTDDTKEANASLIAFELAQEIIFTGFESVLFQLPFTVVELYLNDLGLPSRSTSSSNLNQCIDQILEKLLDLVSLEEFVQLGGDLEPNSKRRKLNEASILANTTISPLPGAIFFTEPHDALAWNNTLLQTAASAAAAAGPPPKLVEVNDEDYVFDTPVRENKNPSAL